MVGCRLSEKPEASLGREHSAPNTIWLQLQDFHLFSFFFFFFRISVYDFVSEKVVSGSSQVNKNHSRYFQQNLTSGIGNIGDGRAEKPNNGQCGY